MSIDKKPGFQYYELPRADRLRLPKGFGITKVDADVIGFYADYFDHEGNPAMLHDVEIVQTADGVNIRNLTLIAKENARIESRASAVMFD